MIPITTKLVDVFLNPIQQKSLIFQSIVQTHGLTSLYLPAGKEPIRPDSVIEVDNHHISACSVDEISAIVVCVAIDVEASSLDEDIHREFACVGGLGRREDVHKETVFRPLAAKLCLELALRADAQRTKLTTISMDRYVVDICSPGLHRLSLCLVPQGVPVVQ